MTPTQRQAWVFRIGAIALIAILPLLTVGTNNPVLVRGLGFLAIVIAATCVYLVFGKKV